MASPTLDGAGSAKMQTLDDAVVQLQHLHAIVERMASAVKNAQPTNGFGPQLRRTGGPMVGLLKGQFGMLSDQVAALLLASTRGGNEQVRVRTLREGIGQLRQALEIATAQVKTKHTPKPDEAKPAADAAK
jgi:hypothetical protein